jgi:hypothetical protein
MQDPKAAAAVEEPRAEAPDTDLGEIVAFLRKVGDVPTPAAARGCDPGRSGLDRHVVEDPAFRNLGG